MAQIDWQMVATIVTASATGVLAWVTWVLVQETRRLADATARPHVVATLEPSPWAIMYTNLILTNSGSGVAYDIRAEFDPPLSTERNGQASATRLRTLSILKPGDTFSVFLDGFEELDDRVVSVTTSWLRSPAAKKRELQTYTLDLRADYFEWGQLGGPPPEFQIASELKKIREDVGRLVGGSRRLTVDTYDARDRLRQRRQWQRLRRARGRDAES